MSQNTFIIVGKALYNTRTINTKSGKEAKSTIVEIEPDANGAIVYPTRVTVTDWSGRGVMYSAGDTVSAQGAAKVQKVTKGDKTYYNLALVIN